MVFVLALVIDKKMVLTYYEIWEVIALEFAAETVDIMLVAEAADIMLVAEPVVVVVAVVVFVCVFDAVGLKRPMRSDSLAQ